MPKIVLFLAERQIHTLKLVQEREKEREGEGEKERGRERERERYKEM